nr:WecB/TagA/CpsF family glycosyltransferase [Bacillus atrophaeus]
MCRIRLSNPEFFIHKCRHLFPQAVAVGLGGSFDVCSGNVKRAPSFFIRLHLEDVQADHQFCRLEKNAEYS